VAAAVILTLPRPCAPDPAVYQKHQLWETASGIQVAAQRQGRIDLLHSGASRRDSHGQAELCTAQWRQCCGTAARHAAPTRVGHVGRLLLLLLLCCAETE